MAAYGLWQVGWGRSPGYLGKLTAPAKSRLAHRNGDALALRSPRRTRPPRPPSGFSPTGISRPASGRFHQPVSELGNHLRPDRNHADKQGNRCQRRRFFHEQPQHEPDSDLRTYEEHCSFFVPGVKGGVWLSLRSAPKRNRVVNVGSRRSRSRGVWKARSFGFPETSEQESRKHHQRRAEPDKSGEIAPVPPTIHKFWQVHAKSKGRRHHGDELGRFQPRCLHLANMTPNRSDSQAFGQPQSNGPPD